MKFLRSIRFRLTAWYTAMLLIGLVLFGAVIFVAGHFALLAATDARLEDRVTRLGEPLSGDFRDNEVAILRIVAQPQLAASVFPELEGQLDDLETDEDRREFATKAARGLLEQDLRQFSEALPAGDFLGIADAAGRRITKSGGATVEFGEDPEPHFATLRIRGTEYRVLTREQEIAGEPYRFVTGASTGPLRAVRREVLSSFRWLIPVFFLFSIMGGYWMSNRTLKPIDEITLAARSIGIEDLSRRLEVSQTDDELRGLTETWNAMLARLEDAVRQLQQFTADASHELRTPTAAVRAMAETILRRERTPAEYQSAIAKMLRETGRMSTLIDDLLMLARADQGAESMSVSSVELDDLVAEACDDYEILADQKSIRLDRSLNASGAIIEGNSSALRRMLIVLLDNGIKYAPADGEVGVSTRVQNGLVVLQVRDNGPGITADSLPHLFDRFYRSDSSRARTVGGAGLGLALAKSIADRHGANITASSPEEGGALFSVAFPVSARSK